MTGPSPSTLRWTLVVATLDRPRMLRACLSLALVQDRPPAEIVVVDASADWRASRQALLHLVESSGVGYRHVPADARSLTVQRNQGIDLATGDVVFLIDDDSLMHPGCAGAVMEVYEADHEQRVLGVQTSLTPEIPAAVEISGLRKVTGGAEVVDQAHGSPAYHRLREHVWREWFWMDGARLFIPYDEPRPLPSLPRSLADLDLAPVSLLHGCRMTFRRIAFDVERFDPVLRAYCPGEDLDLSYRVSRHGQLVTARGARIHHFQSADGRLDRRVATALAVLNQAVLIRRHAADVEDRWRRFDALRRRRVLIEAAKDLLSRRWSMPQLRGMLDASRLLRTIQAMSDAQLDVAYPALQERLLRRRPRLRRGRAR